MPLELLGLTLLAARFFTRRLVAYLIVAGCAIDFSMGVFLHARMQHLDNTAEHTLLHRPELRQRPVPDRRARAGFAEHGGVAQLDGEAPDGSVRNVAGAG